LNLNSENMGETQRTLGREIHTSQNIQEEKELEWNKSNIHLTFRGPYLVIYSYNKTNKVYQFLKFIFGIELYMFRAVSQYIISSLALYTQQ
jgi:hypothetical protein